MNVPRGGYLVKLSVKRVDSQPFTQVERGAVVTGRLESQSAGQETGGGRCVMDDLRASQPSGQPTRSARIFGREDARS